jgi:hypothetical protein
VLPGGPEPVICDETVVPVILEPTVISVAWEDYHNSGNAMTALVMHNPGADEATLALPKALSLAEITAYGEA